MTQPVPLPSNYDWGFVVGRSISAMADTVADPDRLPEARGSNGRVTFTPLTRFKKSLAAPTAFVQFEVVTAKIENGNIVDAQGEDGIYLISGPYNVSFKIDSGSIPSFDILVTPNHTLANPLDLVTESPFVPEIGTPVHTAILPQGAAEDQVIAWRNGRMVWVNGASQAEAAATRAEAAATAAEEWTPSFVWEGTALSVNGGEPVDLKGDGSIAGAIPIFPTLAEAQAWELTNPGRVALTIEDQSPDTTPPVAGTMEVSRLGGTYLEVTVKGATDDRPGLLYDFSRNGGVTWSGWQVDPNHTWMGLALESSHSVTWRVKDVGGNVTSGMTLPVATLAYDPEPPWGTRWADDFSGSGPLIGRKMDDGDGVWETVAPAVDGAVGDPSAWSVTGGKVPYEQASERHILRSGFVTPNGVRGFAATVPVQVTKRALIDMTAARASIWATVGMMMTDAAENRWLIVSESNTLGTGGVWYMPAGGLTKNLALLPDLKPPTASAAYRFEIDASTITVTVDGTQMASIPTPEGMPITSMTRWGMVYGRTSNNAVPGAVESFRIRWE